MRKAASDVVVSFGPMMQMSGSLYSVKQAGLEKETAFKLACPEGDEPHGVSQKYLCDEHDGQWTTAELRRMREADDGSVVFVTPEEIKAAKVDENAEAKTLALAVYPVDEVETNTYPSGGAYVFEPKGKAPLHSLLLATVEREGSHGKALMGEIVLPRSGSKLVRLRSWNGQLVLQELLRPEEANVFDINVPLAEAKYVAMAEALMDQLVEPFDPDQYRNQARERVAALVASKLDPNAPVPVAPTAKTKTSTVDDLEALFAASMTAVAASKAS